MHVEKIAFTFRQLRAVLSQIPWQLLYTFSCVENILLVRRAARFLCNLHTARYWSMSSWVIAYSQLVTALPPTLLLEKPTKAEDCEGSKRIQGPGRETFSTDGKGLKGVQGPAHAGVGTKPVSSGDHSSTVDTQVCLVRYIGNGPPYHTIYIT